ncbi:MAG: hypothetical protein KAS39_08355, partial [Actinomycetia bacterium]|nr:hypothetical protein [Actinomycetes bacterium]
MKKLNSTLLIFLLLFTTAAFAQKPGGSKGQHRPPHMGQKDIFSFRMLKNPVLIEKIGLTEKQIKELEDLKYNMEKTKITLDAEAKLAKLELRKETEKDSPSLKTVETLLDESAKKYAALKKLRTLTYVKAKLILTDKQKEILKAYLAEEFQK